MHVPGLPFELEPDGAPPCQARVADGALTLTAAARTDMFADPANPDGPRPDAGRLLGAPPDGDFRLSARVTVNFGATFDAGVLLVYGGPRRWAKLCYEFSPQLRPTAVTVVTRDVSDDCNSFSTDGGPLWLRITRVGQAWAFHASQDGKWWGLLRYFALPEPRVRVGFLAQSPNAPGVDATFERVQFTAGAPADLRDGS